MRIAVVGAGAIGGAVGALLAREGHEVTLIGRPETVRDLRENGLRVEGPLGAFEVPVAAATTLDFRPELSLLTVKTQDVESTVRANRAFLEGLPLVTMQNGVRSDSMVAGLLPAENLLSAVVMVTATYLPPRPVAIVDRGYLVFGRPTGPPDALVETVAAVLRFAVPTLVSANLVGAHWLKLIMNLNNGLPALTNLTLREVTRDRFLRTLAVDLMREGLRVADRAGIRLEALEGVSVRTVRLFTWAPRLLAARVFALRAGRLGEGWPVLGSTLQSLLRNRPTEIDFLNGEIVRRGRELGIPTPLNEKVVQLVHEVEKTGRFYQPNALREVFSRSADA